MSLRNEIRAAIDDVTPPAPALQQKVEAVVMADDRDRVARPHRSSTRWTRSFRGPMSLVAAALLVVLIGGLVVGGRLLRDLNAPPQTINRGQFSSRPCNQARSAQRVLSLTCPLMGLKHSYLVRDLCIRHAWGIDTCLRIGGHGMRCR